MRGTTAGAVASALALWEPGGRFECDERAESILKVFWEGVQANGGLPPDLRGLAEGALLGPPGTQRALLLERRGERLRVDASVNGDGSTQFRLHLEAPTDGAQLGTEQTEPTRQVQPTDGNGRAGTPLTPREREVALLVADGLRSREVADRLGIAAQTVKSHLKTIFDKLGVRNRVELTRRLAN